MDAKDIIDSWPAKDDLVADLRALGERVTVEAVKKWHERGMIPPDYWDPILHAGALRGFQLSLSGVKVERDRRRRQAADARRQRRQRRIQDDETDCDGAAA